MRSPIACITLLFLRLALPVTAQPEKPVQPTPDTTFLCHFDGPSLAADHALGSKAIRGKPDFVEGIFGEGLSLSGPAFQFDAQGNIDIRRCTIQFWMMDLDWNGKFVNQQRNIFTLRDTAGPDHWYMQIMVINHLVYFRFHFTPRSGEQESALYRLICPGGADQFAVGKWHHFAVGWDVEKRTMWAIVNGEAAGKEQYDLVGGQNPLQRLLDSPPSVATLGMETDSLFVLDDLQILNTVSEAMFADRRVKEDDATEHGSRVSRHWKPSREVVSPHVAWASPYAGGATKVLVAQPWQNLREVVELSQRLDIDYDVVPVTAVDRRCMDSKGMFPYEREDFFRKLRGDARVAILAGIPPQWFSDDDWKELLSQVEAGKSIVWTLADVQHPRIQQLLSAKLPLPAFLKHGPAFPYITLVNPPENSLSAIQHGKGRIVLWNAVTQITTRYSSMTPSLYRGDGEYYYALMARLVLWAADKAPAISVEAANPVYQVAASTNGLPFEGTIQLPADAKEQEVRVDFVVRDTSIGWGFRSATTAEDRLGRNELGRWSFPEVYRESKRVTLKHGANPVQFALPKLVAGRYSFDLQVFDTQGRAVNWDSAMAVVDPSPRIHWLQTAKAAYAEGSTARAELTFDRTDGVAAEGIALHWELTDSFERVLKRGSAPWNGQAKQLIEFPVPAALTKGLGLNVSLRDGDDLLQKARTTFLIPRRRPKPFYYAVYGQLTPRMQDIGADTFISNTEADNLVDMDKEVYYWLDVPGLRVEKKETTVRNPCVTSPDWHNQVEDYFAKIGPDMARQKAIGGLDVDEWDYASWRSGDSHHDLCHSPTCLAAFREFLKKDYAGSLDALNASWSSSYQKWDDVEMKMTKDVDVKQRAAPLVDRLRFNESVVADALGFINDAARKYDPQIRLGLSGTRPANGWNGYDYWKIHRGGTRAIANYGGPMPEESRSFAQPGDFLANWNGYGSNYRATAGEKMWREFIDGKSAFLNYCLFPGFGSHYVDWTVAEGVAAYAKVFAEIDRGLAELVRGAERLTDGVAIHYSQSSIHVAQQRLVGNLTPEVLDADLNSLIQLLDDCGIASRFVSYEQVENGELQKSRFKVLIMPLSTALSDVEVRQIRAFAESGGLVIADAVCGLFDPHGNRRPAGALDDFFGVTRKDTQFVNQLGKLDLDAAFPDPSLAGKKINAIFGEASVNPSRGKVLGTISVGEHKNVPALVIQQHGAGKSIFANTLVSDYNIVTGGGVGGEIPLVTRAKAKRREEAQRFYLALLGFAQVAPQVRVENHTPLEKGRLETLIARHRDGDATYVLVLPGATGTRKLEDRIQNDVTIRFPSVSYLYDVRAGKFLGRADHVDCTLIEGEPHIFAMMPSQVRGAKITMSKSTYAPGEKAGYVVKFSADGLAYVTLTGPDGKPRLAYTTKLEGKNGTCKGEIPFALNDSPGTWTMKARDVATGVEAVAKFEVKQ